MEGFEQLADVLDDGYIMQNAGHHLVGAKRLWDLKKLISSPTWLETKLHSYGVASVVADFRRWVPPASSWPLICCHGRTCKGLLGNPAWLKQSCTSCVTMQRTATANVGVGDLQTWHIDCSVLLSCKGAPPYGVPNFAAVCKQHMLQPFCAALIG